MRAVLWLRMPRTQYGLHLKAGRDADPYRLSDGWAQRTVSLSLTTKPANKERQPFLIVGLGPLFYSSSKTESHKEHGQP